MPCIRCEAPTLNWEWALKYTGRCCCSKCHEAYEFIELRREADKIQRLQDKTMESGERDVERKVEAMQRYKDKIFNKMNNRIYPDFYGKYKISPQDWYRDIMNRPVKAEPLPALNVNEKIESPIHSDTYTTMADVYEPEYATTSFKPEEIDF